MIIAVLLGFFFFILINIPLAFAMGLSSLIYIILSGKITLGIILQRIVGGTDSFALMAVPFYIFGGGIDERERNHRQADKIFFNPCGSYQGWARSRYRGCKHDYGRNIRVRHCG